MNDSINILLKEAICRLRNSGIEDPAGDSRKLLAHALRISKKDLIMINQASITEEIKANFISFIELREDLKPVSQILGFRSFWGRDFYIDENVLDPRPETETIINQALKRKFNKVLDLGTGSGIIIITLLLERQSSLGQAVDISNSALSVAAKNIKKFNLEDRVSIINSNWCEGVNEKFDLIVANPPYIDRSRSDQYDQSIISWEPEIALFSNKNGFGAYLAIAQQLRLVLKDTGVAIFEIGYDQALKVSRIFQNEGFRTSVFKDLSNKDRVIEVTF
jgi:release factor glutamine methyltransferase